MLLPLGFIQAIYGNWLILHITCVGTEASIPHRRVTTVQVDILFKDIIPHKTVGISGDQTHHPWVVSPTPYQLSHMRPLNLRKCP